jgi:hypothetical protein
VIFQCAQCGDTFEKDGIALIVHDTCIVRICPGCVVNANTVGITVVRRAPGRPFEFALLQTDEQSLYEVKNHETQKD